jgi:DNA-binding winged helix-turn-helix (wHTH) protein/tetratricopeptide (TPR) repeat protein
MDLHAYRFANFLVDPAKRVLLRDGVAATLPPKAFDVIVYLLEQRERAVGRDELIAAVWGKADITDNALGQVVLQARRALDDSGDGGQRIILTVPRFGYRWVAQVMREDIAGDSEPYVTEQMTVADVPVRAERLAPRTPSSRGWRKRSMWMAVAVGALAVVFALWRDSRLVAEKRPAASTAFARSTIIVLPVVVDAPAALAWVRLGVMDLVAQRLRAAGQVVVPSDNVVGLAHRFTDAEGALDTAALVQAIGAADRVETHAQWRDDRWSVVLRMPAHSALAEAEDSDVIVAARVATDRLARSIGLHPPDDAGAAPGLAGLLQQVRAAILSEQLDSARTLLLGAGSDERARPEIRYHLAEIDFRSGRLDQAEQAMKGLFDDGSANDMPDLRGRVLNALANIAYQRNDYPAVETYSAQALQWLASRNEPGQTGRALIGRATARAALHRYDEAVADFAQARVAFEAAGDGLALARVDAYLGLLDLNRDRAAEALPLLRGAVERLQAFDAVVEELHARVGIVQAELTMLDPAAALAQCARLRELAARVSDPRRKNYAGIACIEAQTANGRYSDAVLLLREVRAQADPPEETLLRQSRTKLFRVAAELALAVGDPTTAVEEAAAALALPGDFDAAGARARIYLSLLRAQLALGRSDTVTATAAAARSWGEQHAEADVLVYTSLVAAEYALAQDDVVRAEAAFAESIAAADASRMPVNLLVAAQAYAGQLLDVGDLEKASVVIGRVAPWSTKSYDAALLQVRLYRTLDQARPWQAALQQARELAGERVIPPPLRTLPAALKLSSFKVP